MLKLRHQPRSLELPDNEGILSKLSWIIRAPRRILTSLGLMSHASFHPCSCCNSEKDKLHCEGTLRTLGSIRSQYWRFTEPEKRTTRAKELGNCIHPPLFKFADDTLVLDIMPPPELHLLLGTVNFLYSNLEKVWVDVIQWPSSVYIEREAIHGGSFTGNACRKLLRNVDALEEIIPSEPVLIYTQKSKC